jgi:hypothetical protein
MPNQDSYSLPCGKSTTFLVLVNIFEKKDLNDLIALLILNIILHGKKILYKNSNNDLNITFFLNIKLSLTLYPDFVSLFGCKSQIVPNCTFLDLFYEVIPKIAENFTLCAFFT